MRNKLFCILLAVVCMAGCLAGCSSNEPKVSVQSVADIVGIGPIGVANRYAGVIEAGDTVSVKKDSTMEISDIAVNEGDAVTKGQVLFTYDTSSLAIDVERMQLELEQMNNGITTKKSQITTLEKEQKTASTDQKLQYTIQIQQLQLDVKEAEYNVAAKQKEIDRAKVKLADANVLSPVNGHVKSINNDGNNAADPMMNGGDGTEADAFISITEEGELRVRGTVNEQNAQSFAEGTKVLIRSRVDESTFWNGTVTAVDWENPVKNENSYYYSSSTSDEMTTTSKYPFYVKLDGDVGLMLGQHVYIEPDVGQGEGGGDTSTFYLPAYFLSELDADPYVWAANDSKKLEKRTVTLGNYDIQKDSYEILDGLTADDFIAYPDETCKEGAPVLYPGEEDDSDPGKSAEGETPAEGELPAEGEEPGITTEPGSSEVDGPLTDEGIENGDIIGGMEGFLPDGLEATPKETATSAADSGSLSSNGTEAVG